MMENDARMSEKIALIRQHMERGQMDETLDALEALLEIAPGDEPIRKELCPLFVRLSIRSAALERAMHWLEEAITADDTLSNELHQYVAALIMKGDLAEALSLASKLSGILPGSFRNVYHLGMILTYLRKYEDAGRHLRKAIELKEDFGEAYASLANLYIHLGRHERAGSVLRTYLEKGLRSPEVYECLEYLLANRRLGPQDTEFFEAQLRYQQARKALNVGWMHLTEGDMREGIIQFGKAMEYDGRDPEVFLDLKRVSLMDMDRHIPEVKQLCDGVDALQRELLDDDRQ